MSGPELKTSRLLLRRWRPSDREPFAELNAHQDVVEFLPRPLNRKESDQLLDRLEVHFDERGFSFWAVETSSHPLIGFVGLGVPKFEAHFRPCVEIGWRLARSQWGHGYATEGAKAVLHFAFEELELPEVVSFTNEDNHKSRAVMERLQMTYDAKDDFYHPGLAEGHPLRRHVLYRLNRNAWRDAKVAASSKPRSA